MIKELAFSIAGNKINAPGGIPTGDSVSISKIIGWGVAILIIIAIFMTLIFMMWAGVNWAKSQGNKEKIQNEKNKFKFAIIGLIIIIIALPIMWAYLALFGIKLY